MKKCFKCGKAKPLSAFYAHKRMSDGHLNKCKACTKNDALVHRINNLEIVREYDKERSKLPHRVKARKKIAERWKADPKLKKRRNKLHRLWAEKNSIKRAAHVMTGNAIRDGRLIKKPCEVCGKKKVEAHHDDYLKPFDVRWLCKKHHTEAHVALRDKERPSEGSATQRDQRMPLAVV